MTPKEKAIELYLLFKQRTYYVEVVHTPYLLDKFHNNAISCAMIAVNEILEELPEGSIDYGISARRRYFEEVKQELEKWNL